MRVFGWVCVVMGCGLLLAGYFMDTTVASGSEDGLAGVLSRVNNMGLMARRQLLTDLGRHGTLVGVLLIGFARVADEVTASAVLTERRLVDVVDKLSRLQVRADGPR